MGASSPHHIAGKVIMAYTPPGPPESSRGVSGYPLKAGFLQFETSKLVNDWLTNFDVLFY
jgi:hypothetical protein